MSPTPRMRRALDRIEARRVELERAIISEMERRFFTGDDPEIDETVGHLGAAGMLPPDDPATMTAGQFSITWFA